MDSQMPTGRPETRVMSAANALAFLATVFLGVVTLLASTYRVTTCFSRPDGFGGCGTVLHPFSFEALPALIWPAGVFVGLTFLAALAWRAPSTPVAAVATTAFAALAGGAILSIAPSLVGPLALLVLAFSLRSGRSLPKSLTDLVIAMILTVLAIASSYTILLAATLWRGGWLSGIAPAMWIYLAFATAVAIGVGCALATRPDAEELPFAKGALVSFGICGAAGVIALLPMAGPPDLKAMAFRSLFVIAAVAVPLGVVALSVVLRVPRARAFAGTLVAAVAFPISVAITIGMLTSIAPGSTSPASIGPELPRVPWLPGTSTLP